MSRIKLNLRQAIPDKLQTGRQIIAAMTNNPNFATPHPPLADVSASLATLDEAYKAHQIAKSDARAKANDLLNRIENRCWPNGNPTTALP